VIQLSARNDAGVKARLLFLERYFLDHTDDKNVLTTEEIVKLCTEHGYKTQRITVADDMATLAEAGLDVISERIPTPKTAVKAYHIGSRLFELAELKMLVDAVSSSRCITAEKSDLLISKLSKLTNEQNRPGLLWKVYNVDRLKTTNPAVFVSIDTIRSAIEQHRKLFFHMWDYTPEKQKVLRHDGEPYIASPYALIWNDDRYYLAAWSDRRNKLVKYRVDRMCGVEMLDAPTTEIVNFKPEDYVRKVIRMYDGDLPETRVTLRCENDLMQNVLDRFGEETSTEVADKKTFRAFINVVPSSTFLSWVFQYQGRILIESPWYVQDSYETMLKDAAKRQRKLDRELLKKKREQA